MKIPIFLDRDGVISREPSSFGMDYITDLKYFEFLPGIEQALKLLCKNGYHIYIISNQAGVSKGLYTYRRLMEISEHMLRKLKESGVEIKGVKYCIHREEDGCECRKPKTKFLQEIFESYPSLKKDKIFFVGDQERDLQTGLNFGISSILVLSGKTGINELFKFEVSPSYVASDLYDAVKNIILR